MKTQDEIKKSRRQAMKELVRLNEDLKAVELGGKKWDDLMCEIHIKKGYVQALMWVEQ